MDIALAITQTAEEKFGIVALKPYQILVMHKILEQEETDNPEHQLIILPTGTGKSICFMIPGYLCRGKTIIVYPLLALMNDQINVLKKAGMDCVCFRGGQTNGQRKQLYQKLKTGTKIIITNPETLIQKTVLNILKNFEVSLFVCDEAHVVSQWGSEFRPAYRRLKECTEILKPHQVLAFTATADDAVVADIGKYLFPSVPVIVRGDADRENIFYSVIPAPDKLIGVHSILKKARRPAIVFCGTRNDAFTLCIRTKALMHDIQMMYYHAGLSKTERETVEKWFMDSNDGVLFSTCAFGMGVSKNNIRTVIHSYLPSNVLEYLQESGRAGRDMEQAWAYVILEPPLKAKTKENKVEEIFRGNNCRRIELLKELGQQKDECTGCDVCTGTVEKNIRGSNEIIRLIRTRPLRYTFADLPWLLGQEKDYRFIREGFELDKWHKTLSDMNRYEIEETCKALIDNEQGNGMVLQKMDLPWKKGLLYVRKRRKQTD